MPLDSKHYYEPWEVSKTWANSVIYDSTGVSVAKDPMHAARITECINACEGTNDPQPGELLALRKVIKKLYAKVSLAFDAPKEMEMLDISDTLNEISKDILAAYSKPSKSSKQP